MKLDYRDKKQFLAAVRKLAQDSQVAPQIMLQEVVLDDLLDRIVHSKFRDNLVLKGGFLIASLLGADTRSTRDIDTVVTGLPVTKDEISQVFQEICAIRLPNDDIQLQIRKIDKIREDAEYVGFRMHIRAKVFVSLVDVKVDISTGDVITERAISYGHKLLLEDRIIQIMAYNVETIIAEKLQTIVNRGEINTRLKDYYDLYRFANDRQIHIDFDLLKRAVVATANNRKDGQALGNYTRRITQLASSNELANYWQKYQSENSYAADISFRETCLAAGRLVNRAHIDD